MEQSTQYNACPVADTGTSAEAREKRMRCTWPRASAVTSSLHDDCHLPSTRRLFANRPFLCKHCHAPALHSTALAMLTISMLGCLSGLGARSLLAAAGPAARMLFAEISNRRVKAPSAIALVLACINAVPQRHPGSAGSSCPVMPRNATALPSRPTCPHVALLSSAYMPAASIVIHPVPYSG